MIAERGESRLVEVLHHRADLAGIPLSGTFELTPMCSMACKMCYVRMTAEEVRASGKRLRTMDEWLDLARQIRDRGTLLLLLTGGEPFTYPHFRELYEALRGMGFVISINTNATLIDAETVAWLAKNPPQRLNITLYGSSDETYARLCGHPTGYTVVTRAIEMLREAGIFVKLNCSVTPENVGDLEEIIRYSDDNKLILQATSYMFPPLRRDEESIGVNERFTPEDCARTEARIRLLQRGADNLRQYCEAIETHQPPPDDPLDVDCEGERMRCRAGKSSFWITWDGRMVPCGMLNDPAEYPFENGFAETWTRIRERAGALRLSPECVSCDAKDYCHTCAAMVYTETGTYSHKPQYRCDLMRATPHACRMVLKEAEKNDD